MAQTVQSQKNPAFDGAKKTSNNDAVQSSALQELTKVPKNIPKDLLHIIPEDLAKKHNVVVFAKGDGLLKAVVVDPQNVAALNILRFISAKEKVRLETYRAGKEIFGEILEQYGSDEKAVAEAVEALEQDDDHMFVLQTKQGRPQKQGEESIQDAPVAKLVQVIIKHALDGKASDIHIEPIDGSFRVRFRVDGILHASLTLPMEVGKATVARIKILSNLKIDEKRKPQDGRFRVEDNGSAVDFRVSTLPVIEGEKVVMRVLEKDRQDFDLKHLGLLGKNYEIFSRRIRDPYGMILMTGPTGSGKSTTLYAFLKILNQEERNIITLEDPVEYFIGGINQSQIKPEIGYTFANGLRSILRQDPNVIMVGEIRDTETAELAVHSALTGHLVFSTVHTNNAIGAIPRLVDMGVEGFLLASSLSVIAAQRLVRLICPLCKVQMKVPKLLEEKIRTELQALSSGEAEKYGVDLSKPLVFYRGKGCEECGKLGLRGRMAIYEVLEIDDIIKEIISEKDGSEGEIQKEAKQRQMVTMKQDGLLKALLGMTTLSEVERVTEGSLSIGGKMDEISNMENESHEQM